MVNGSQDGIAEKVTVRELVGHAIVLCVLLCILFPGVPLRGEVLAPGDVLFIYPPWSDEQPADLEIKNPWWTIEAITALNKFYWMSNRALDAGEWPLWNDLEMGGMPLIANGQSAVFYPPRLLHRVMDLFKATTLYILLKLFLCGMSAYVCARVMRMERASARVVSIGWMLCGYNVLWSYWPLPDVSVWLPLELAAVELLLQRRYRKGFYTLAIAATLLMFAGHPETAFTGSLWIGGYFFMRLAWAGFSGREVWKPLVLAGAGWGVALLASAVQVLPTLEYLANTSRVESFGWTTGYNHLEWNMLHGFWLPNYAAQPGEPAITVLWVAWLFVGLTVWLGLSAGAIQAVTRRELSVRSQCLAAGATVALFFSVSNPITERLLLPPGIASMWQRYHIPFVLLALLLLGGIGLDSWLRRKQTKREVRALQSLVALVLAVALTVYWSSRPLLIVAETNGLIVRQLAIAGMTLSVGAVLLTLRAQRFRPSWIGLAIACVLAVELIVNLGRYHHTVPREHLFVETELTNFLQEQHKPIRVHTPNMIPGLLPFYGVEVIRGYDGLYPKHAVWQLARADAPPSMRRALAITHTLATNLNDDVPRRAQTGFSSEQRELLGAFGTSKTIEVYRVTDSLPRAYLVPALEVVVDDESIAERMATPDFAPDRIALTADTWEEPFSTSAIDLGGADVTRQATTAVEVEVTAEAPAVLVLADTHYPGWRAYRNGERVALLRINRSMRGIVLPSGESSVVFRFEPTSFMLGLWISTVTLVIGSIVGFYMSARDWRRRLNSRGRVDAT